MRLLYLSHPEVVIDPAVPVPDWGLSDEGRARAEAAAAAGWPGPGWRIACSAERKARETAAILAGGSAVRVHPGLGEVDRSSTGYVPADRHEELAGRLFAHPDVSADGWETARAAQARCRAALWELMAEAEGDLLLVGHGGVGTFLWCALSGIAIDRRHEQPRAGCVWQAQGAEPRPVHGWRLLEDVAAARHEA